MEDKNLVLALVEENIKAEETAEALDLREKGDMIEV